MSRHSRRYHNHVPPAAPPRPAPSTCLWSVGGWSFRLNVWSDPQWARLPPGERPPRAQRLEGPAGGWATLAFNAPAPPGPAPVGAPARPA